MLQARTKKPAILFVCLGNICRSPMAEGAFRAAAEKAGLDLTVDSAGTANYHIGEAPDPRAIKTANAHGVNIAHSAGRQLSENDFHAFTHIFALDKANMAGIKARAPRHGTAHIALLMDVVPGQQGQSVPDPYYGEDADFEDCWETITIASDALVEAIKQHGIDAVFPVPA